MEKNYYISRYIFKINEFIVSDVINMGEWGRFVSGKIYFHLLALLYDLEGVFTSCLLEGKGYLAERVNQKSEILNFKFNHTYRYLHSSLYYSDNIIMI